MTLYVNNDIKYPNNKMFMSNNRKKTFAQKLLELFFAQENYLS